MDGRLRVETIRPRDLGEGDLSLWRGFVGADASPFFHPAFTQIAGEVAPGARVAVFHRGGQIAGFFPYQKRGSAVQPIGAPLNDYHGLIAGPGLSLGLEEMPSALGARSLAVTGWTQGAEAASGVTATEGLLADLPHGWDAYEAERRAAHAKYFRDKERSRRAVERDFGEMTVRLGVTDRSTLERLVELKREQYRRSHRHDVFACGWTVELLDALMRHPQEGFGASMAVLEAGGEPLAIEYALHAGGLYHFWIPAYEPEAARYSPGILLSLDTMRIAAGQGFTTFDLGLAGAPYKKYFQNRSQTVLEGTALAPGLSAAAFKALDGPLTTSFRRRWAAIEACETTFAGQARGLALAARAFFAKSTPMALAATLPGISL